MRFARVTILRSPAVTSPRILSPIGIKCVNLFHAAELWRPCPCNDRDFASKIHWQGFLWCDANVLKELICNRRASRFFLKSWSEGGFARQKKYHFNSLKDTPDQVKQV